ncbi:hypothetical protein C6341_g15864 [Phytophthora cactorum]|nr:hypothetical protein C6341_g15864 [Phytophthora cactorum]KAG4050313.1 hypothetical protein PC123_g14441 [Phytophthora cactorum]
MKSPPSRGEQVPGDVETAPELDKSRTHGHSLVWIERRCRWQVVT